MHILASYFYYYCKPLNTMYFSYKYGTCSYSIDQNSQTVKPPISVVKFYEMKFFAWNIKKKYLKSSQRFT